MDIIAKTGVMVGGGTPVALAPSPSINDAGKVAFVARNVAGTQANGRIMLLNDGVIEEDCPVGALASASDAVQVNNTDQVIFRMYSNDGLFSDVVRLDNNCGGPILGRGSMSSQFPQPFDVVLPSPTLNASGRGVFSGDVGSNTRLGSRADGTGAYNVSPFLTGFPNLFPMIADNDTTVVRWGATITSPLLRFIDTATTFNTANFIADSTNFNAIGEQPGMSDDGNVIAFAADHKTQGLGIYISLFTGTTFAPIKVIGIGGTFSNFSLQPRVGVNRSSLGSVTNYTLAYIGFSASGKLGLYTTAIDITDPAAPVVSAPSLAAEAGGAIAGLTGTVNNIRIYDPVNNKGEVVFWVSTDTGAQAIVKATPSAMDAFDPACDFLSTVCDGSFLKDSNGKVIVDETKLDSIAAANIQRGGIVTDGVTKLLLRIKTNEAVTFVLRNPSGQTADNAWGVLSDLAETTQGNTVTINPVTTVDGPAAFAVYHAPLDLPCSYNTTPCAASEIAGSLRVRVEASSVSSVWKKFLNLLPPPLVLVHGVWSNIRAWLDMAGFLEQKGFIVCPGCLVDYGTNSPAGSFDPLDPDTYVIKELISSTKLALTFMRLNNIAATQVDVVGHSMGGLVARAVTVFRDAVDQYKVKKNYNKGSFHKIITVGTPHLGTQMADFLVKNKCKTFLGIPDVTLEKFFNKREKPIGAAIFGFETASPALQRLGATNIPSHTIIGLAPPSSTTEEVLNIIIRAFVSPSENVDHIID
ncbi:MAG: alpha/beta fold hydrolase, partial [Patescibacteria group bacterium]